MVRCFRSQYRVFGDVSMNLGLHRNYCPLKKERKKAFSVSFQDSCSFISKLLADCTDRWHKCKCRVAKEEWQISCNAVASQRNFFLKLKAKGEEITLLITENYSCSIYAFLWAFWSQIAWLFKNWHFTPCNRLHVIQLRTGNRLQK